MSVPAKWSFRLTDAALRPIGEVLNASERKVKIGIRQLDVASFKIRADNALLLPLFAEDTLLQVWQGSELRFWGPVITPEFATEDAAEPTIAVNAVSPSWKLLKRLSNKTAAPVAYPGTPDKGYVANNEIDKTNTLDGDTGILVNAGALSGSLGAYTIAPFKQVMSIIRELANGFDGFDWQFTPLPASGTKIARFDAAPLIGSQRPDSVFEFGCGRHNVRGMTFKRDLSGLLNRAWHITDNGVADPLGIIHVDNPTSQAEHGVYEEVIESAALFDSTLRTAWARENVEVRGVPRLIATMTSDFVEASGRTPEAWVDYIPGDLVKARAVSHGVQLFDAFVRCYNIEVNVDQAGTPTFVPTLIEEEGEGAEAV